METTKTTSKIITFIKKRQVLFVIVLVALLMLLMGKMLMKHREYQKSVTTFMPADKSFSVEHPQSWTVHTDVPGAMVAVLVTDAVPSSSPMKPYINIAKGSLTGTLDEAFTSTVFKYKKLFKNMSIIEQTDTKFGGEPAKRITFEGNQGGKAQHYSVVVAKHKDEIYSLAAAAYVEDAAIADEQLNRVLKTWKFLQ